MMHLNLSRFVRFGAAPVKPHSDCFIIQLARRLSSRCDQYRTCWAVEQDQSNTIASILE